MNTLRVRVALLLVGAFSAACYVFLSYQSAHAVDAAVGTEAIHTAISGGGLSLPDVQLIKKIINIAVQLLPAY